jgi:hypothetical protein
VFAVGEAGAIIHFNGTNWSVMTSGATAFLRGVWGASANDVFAVGDGGTILHYNGSSWSAMNSGTTVSLESVWGSSASDVFAVGADGTILHYDGSSWSPQDSGFVTPQPSPRPLVTRILGVPEYRTAYENLHRALIAGPFAQAAMDAQIDSIYNLIRQSVYSDTLKQYSDQDFDDNISQDVPPTGPNRTLGLKTFVTRRTVSINSQLP